MPWTTTPSFLVIMITFANDSFTKQCVWKPQPLSFLLYVSVRANRLSPSHSESPYTGRWCTLWGRPDSLRYTTGFPASLLQHTGYSVSARSPQTAVCQSEKHGKIKKEWRVKIIRWGTEPGMYIDSTVWVLSASVGIFEWKLVLLAQDPFRPFFPSLDKWGAEFSWTGRTSGECWAPFPHWKHLLEWLGCLGHMLFECFHLITEMWWEQGTGGDNPGKNLDRFAFFQYVATSTDAIHR